MNRDKNSAFTIIELMLAMAFVSALLLAVAMTVIQISKSYNRGLTMKDVNEVGTTLSNEIKNTINQSEAFNVTVGATGSKYIKQDWGGRLCIGNYSFIWNYGKALSNNDQSHLNIYSTSTNSQIRFVKVLDPSGSYCSNPSKKVVQSDSTELLDAGQHNLTIHKFSILSNNSAYDATTGQRLYIIEFVIGTNDQAALSYSSGSATCRLANESNANQQYCMINRFNLTARAGNVAN